MWCYHLWYWYTLTMEKLLMARYSYEGQSEDMHSWFFLYDEKIANRNEDNFHKQVSLLLSLCNRAAV